MHSSHESKFKDKKLSAKVPVDLLQSIGIGSISGSAARNDDDEDGGDGDGGDDNDGDDFDKGMKKDLLKKRHRDAATRSEQLDSTTAATATAIVGDRTVLADSLATMARMTKRAEINEKSEEFRRLRDELLRSRRAVHVLTGSEATKVVVDA